jgi:uncharacterized protein (DUF2336 family)
MRAAAGRARSRLCEEAPEISAPLIIRTKALSISI